VQCSAVQCSAVQCSAVQCSAVQCSAVQCNAVQGSGTVEHCSAVQWDSSAHLGSRSPGVNSFLALRAEGTKKMCMFNKQDQRAGTARPVSFNL
jgi:hypothetical protein